MTKTELTPEQKAYYDRELANIRRGGYSHDAWVHDGIAGMGSTNLGPVDPPVVGLANDSDGHYTQWFQNHEELEAFVVQLRETAEEAWGPAKLKWADRMAFDTSGRVEVRTGTDHREEFLRTLWEVCQVFGTTGECIWIVMKHKMNEVKE